MPNEVQIERHTLVNFSLATLMMLGFDQLDNALAIATIGFDVSVAALIPLLLIGTTITVALEKVAGNGSQDRLKGHARDCDERGRDNRFGSGVSTAEFVS